MLVKEVKSSLQYWLTDCAQWPRIQKIAINLLASLRQARLLSVRSLQCSSSTLSSATNIDRSSWKCSPLSRQTCPLVMKWRCPTIIKTWKSLVPLMMNKDIKPLANKIGVLNQTENRMNNDFKTRFCHPWFRCPIEVGVLIAMLCFGIEHSQ
jgi:hypothetical protein